MSLLVAVEDLAHHRIGFRMHAGGVERILAALDAQEAGALLERLRAEPRHFLQRLARLERAVGVAVLHDALRQPRADARHPRQQRRRGGVGVDPDGVDAIFHHGIERARQLALAEVMLVLPDADRLGIDLDQFGQRILQPPRDRDRAAQGDVELRQFLRGKGRRRIDRGAGFRHHDLRHLQVGQQFYQFHRELVGLARRGAVADRDQVDAMRDRELAQRRQRLVPALLRFMRIDRRGRHHLAGGVDHRDLDAGTEAGIEPHGDARAGGRRQQQVAQIGGEHPHGFLLGGIPQPHPQIDVEMHLNLGAPGPAHGLQQPFVAGAALIGNGKTLHDLHLMRTDRRPAWRRPARAASAGRGFLPSRRGTWRGCDATAVLSAPG